MRLRLWVVVMDKKRTTHTEQQQQRRRMLTSKKSIKIRVISSLLFQFFLAILLNNYFHNIIFSNAFSTTTLVHVINEKKSTRQRQKQRRLLYHTTQKITISGSSFMKKSTDDEKTTFILYSSSSEDTEEQEDLTYFSPNVQLDTTKYRYDLRQDDDDDDDNESKDTSSPSTSSSVNEYSFFDEATIYVRAGSGGQGASTYKKGIRGQDGQPDGGNGGNGGNVIIQGDKSLNTLAGLTNAWRPNSFGGSGSAKAQGDSSSSGRNNRLQSFKAENGHDGQRNMKNGKFGKDTIIRVPYGTLVQEEIQYFNEDRTEVIETTLIDIGTVSSTSESNSNDINNKSDEDFLVVAYGGEGGEGTSVLLRMGRGVRRPRISPKGGRRKRLKLTLKVVADIAIVGVPNCGKSTFLASVTRAKPKIANYPFTTVIPNLGVWIPSIIEDSSSSTASYLSDSSSSSSGSGLVLCDVPGLIAGAAEGVGLGHAFLRHVERCHVILHLVDATSINPIEDFHMVNREIMNYGNGKLATMPQIVVINKIDAYGDDDDTNAEDKSSKNDTSLSESESQNETTSTNIENWEKGLKTKISKEELEKELREAMTHSRLMFMSAKGKLGVDELMGRMVGFVQKVKAMNEEQEKQQQQQQKQ